MDRATELVKYLESCKGCTDVQAVKVALGGEEFLAASYKQTLDTPHGSRAYFEGERTYTREAIYCLNLSPLPKSYVTNKNRVAYSRTDDAREWYVAGYSPKAIPADKREFYPFGHFFLLMPWSVNSTIDQYERRPYKRVPMEVHALATVAC